MNREDYIRSSATTRVYEKYLLKGPIWDRLIEAEDRAEFKRILSETRYESKITDLEPNESFEKVFKEEIEELYQTMYHESPEREPIELLATRYIFHNLKVVIKSYLLERDLSHLFYKVGNYDYHGMLEDLKVEGSVNRHRPFANILNQALESYKTDHNPQNLDMLMDQYEFEYMDEIAEGYGVEFFIDFVRDTSDVQNITMFGRGQKQNHRVNCIEGYMLESGHIDTEFFEQNYFDEFLNVIESLKGKDMYPYLASAVNKYNEDQRMRHFDDELNDYILNKYKEGSMLSYGPEVLFSYILRKENEVRLLRIIITSIRNGIPSSYLKTRLGDISA